MILDISKICRHPMICFQQIDTGWGITFRCSYCGHEFTHKEIEMLNSLDFKDIIEEKDID